MNTSPDSGSDPAQPNVQHVGDSVTTGTIPVVTAVVPKPANPGSPRPVRRPLALWLGVFVLGCLLLGVIAGVVWEAVVPLTTYLVNDDGSAATTERGLANYVAGDAFYCLIGVVLGLAAGLVAWWWFAGLGGRSVLLATLAATLMAVVTWFVGWALGPGAFEPRLAAAQPGDVLPIELTIRAYAGILLWPFAACLPPLLLAALTNDPEDVQPAR